MRIYLHESSARCPWSREINGKHIFVTISATWMNILLVMVSLIVFRTYTYIWYGIKMKTTDRWQLIQRWWRHQMETFFALLALYEGNSPVTGEPPPPPPPPPTHTHTQRPVTQSFDVFFDLCLNKRLGKPSWRRWFETPSRVMTSLYWSDKIQPWQFFSVLLYILRPRSSPSYQS